MNLLFEIKLELLAWYMAARRVVRHYPRMLLENSRRSAALDRDRVDDWRSHIDRRLSKGNDR